ncbi:hypothetical protein GMES_1018 [Paraglaciecola mesophila KMM 241]|uniref:Uncharacterized protein n=1 Tax=Paraglaciecola mesophila KMM 241 TaxID=1128912 RepID=K6YYU9_9ALTE|nr:hypothetical protein [Paraglaciecola mesophila]GAC23317.1 hypothetical protein GMES_1018 [Paraglaciecola mesophila KMM 241]
MNVVDKKTENSQDAVSNRRKFLLKGSAAALIVSLPSKATWATTANGFTVSGNLSGNLSQACTTTTIAGVSPATWLVDAKNDQNLKDSLKAVKWDTVFSISTTGTYTNNNGGVVSRPHLYRVLWQGSDIDKSLVAGYLNAYYGNYPLSSEVTPEMYASMLEEEAMNNQGALMDALSQTYTR